MDLENGAESEDHVKLEAEPTEAEASVSPGWSGAFSWGMLVPWFQNKVEVA